MKVDYTRTFKKQYKKLPKKIQNQFDERLMLYCENPAHPLLKVHTLHAERTGLQSLNINADHRAIFSSEGEIVIFHEIGSHSQLYS